MTSSTHAFRFFSDTNQRLYADFLENRGSMFEVKYGDPYVIHVVEATDEEIDYAKDLGAAVIF